MGQTKSKFDPQDVMVADFARALALPVRISIIRLLIEHGDWMISTRFNCLPLVPEVAEKHLNALKTVGLVNKMTKNGFTFYRLNFETFKCMSGYFNVLIKEVS